MSEGYYLYHDGETIGPYPLEDIRSWLSAGTISPEMFYWSGEEWRAVSELAGLETLSGASGDAEEAVAQEAHEGAQAIESDPAVEAGQAVEGVAAGGALAQDQLILAEPIELEGMPNVSECLLADAVSVFSPAHLAGILPGDYLVSIGDAPAGSVGPEFVLDAPEQRDLVIYSPEYGQYLSVATKNIDPGALWKYTPQAVAVGYDADYPDYDSLDTLWEAGEFDTLEQLAADTIAKHSENSPALALRGAALMETGMTDEGWAKIVKYEKEYRKKHPERWHAICLYYLSMRKIEGNPEEGEKALRESFAIHPHRTVALALEEITGELPVSEQKWVGQTIDLDYSLSMLGSFGDKHSLADDLAQMSEQQVILLCFLEKSRGSVPYNDIMKRFIAYHTQMPQLWYSMHVILMERKREQEEEHFYEAEDRAKADGRPLQLLFDSDGSVTAKTGAESFPYLLAIDRNRRVVHEGELHGATLWNMLAALGY